MLLSETLLCHDTDLIYITNINQDVSESNILVDVCDIDQISIMTQ
jgi:hypothetical protein